MAVAAALLFSACDGDDSDVAGPSATVSVAPGDTPTPEVSPSETEVPSVDGSATPAFEEDDEVLTVAVQEAATLDPMRIEDPAAVLIARQLYEGLTKWDPVRERVEPAAAQDWKIADKGRRFTFDLRDDMTFHDGTPVTARDFKFAFDRIAEKANASNIAYTLERIEGFEETNQLGQANALRGVKAVDEDTLEIKLSEPFYELPVVLTHPGLVPVPADAVRDVDEFLARPIGNGAFEMTNDWSPGETLELRTFSDFHEAAGVDGLRFVPYDDAAASWVPFVTGQLDVAEIPADRIDVAVDRFGDEGVLPLLAGYYYGFNVTADNLRDENLREAITRAVDRQAIARSIYKRTLQTPRGVVPAGMPGFQKNACKKLCAYSKSAARKAVKKVPKKEREVTLAYTKGQPHQKVANAVAGDLEDVGLDVDVKAFEFPKYLRQLTGGSHEMYRYGWIAEYPSPSVFLTSLFLSGSPDNHSEFGSKKVDKLLRQAGAERNETKRLRKYVQAEKLILRELPVAPIGSFVTHWAAGERVGSIVWDTMGGFDAVDVSLADEDEA